MKQFLWIHIPVNDVKLLDGSLGKPEYESFDNDFGKVEAFKIINSYFDDEITFNNLKSMGVRYSVFRREYKFSKKEIENAEILVMKIDDCAKGSGSEEHKGVLCNECGLNYLSIRDTCSLFLNSLFLKKVDICCTYMGESELLVSQQLADELVNKFNISGRFEQIYDYRKGDCINSHKRLILEEGIGSVIFPSIVEKGGHCQNCDTYDTYLCQTPLFFKRNEWGGKSICYTKDWFGQPRLSQGKTIIINSEMYRFLRDKKIKSVSFEPAFLIN